MLYCYNAQLLFEVQKITSSIKYDVVAIIQQYCRHIKNEIQRKKNDFISAEICKVL